MQRSPLSRGSNRRSAGAHLRNVPPLAAGAHLRNAPPLAAGARGTVSLEGTAIPVPFVVRSVDDRGALQIEFEMNQSVRLALVALLDRLRRRQAA